jgi:phenylalanyl-tRNA synthetase beta chain
LKLSFDWLCDYADFRSWEFPKIVEKINLSICEIDDIEEMGKELSLVRIVRIVEIKPHPNADKLRVTQATDGNKKYQVVTGAANVKENDLVPLAFPSAVLGGKEIRESELRGVPSFGMYCSDKEMGLSEDASGVRIISEEIALGKTMQEYLQLSDTILTIDNKSITHRPDLWSHFGFARELAAQLNLKLKFDPYNTQISFASGSDIQVIQNDKALSYYACVIEGVKVGNSNHKIKSRLEKCGVRSINNVVDVSNYVMLEMGQPTHFFDKDKLGKVEISVNSGEKGKNISLLDDSVKELNEDILCIYNQKDPIAIAGVMGGKDSSVTENTSHLLLESAVFPREMVRKSIRKTGIRSESSIRYEKGLNHFSTKPVLQRAIELLQENGCPQIKAFEPQGFTNDPSRKVVIQTNFAFLEKKLGKKFPDEQILDILSRLGFIIENKGGELTISVPPYRHNYDITIPEDIVEEVGRSIGYAEIGTNPLVMQVVPAVLNDQRLVERSIKKILSGNYRYNEVFNYSFASYKDIHWEGQENSALEIQNSMPEEQRFLRNSVYPSILHSISVNVDRFEIVKVFELARVYFAKPNSLGEEKRFFSLGVMHNRKSETIEQMEEDFLNIRNEVLSIFRLLNIESIEMKSISKGYLHPGASVGFFQGNVQLGELGYLHPEFQESYDLKKRVLVGKLFLEEILKLFIDNKRRFEFKPPSAFPQASLDISLVLEESESTDKYAQLIQKASIEEVQDIWVSAIYKGESVPSGKKSVTYRISLLNYKETFTPAKINSLTESLISIAKENGFVLR